MGVGLVVGGTAGEGGEHGKRKNTFHAAALPEILPSVIYTPWRFTRK
jgi:hypothetical protein